MNDLRILNASPLITLGKADLLRQISPLAHVWVLPEGVIQEIEVKRSIEFYLAELSSHAQVIRETVANIHPSIIPWELGQGESKVLTIGLEKPGAGVVLDDLQARKCAKLLDIPLIGSLGIILSAKKKGVLSEAKPAINRIIAAGLYVDPDLLTQILTKIGEHK